MPTFGRRAFTEPSSTQPIYRMQPVQYPSLERLLLAFKEAILDRAWEKRQALQRQKIERVEMLSVDDFLRV